MSAITKTHRLSIAGRPAGFSLFELMIVMAVIALISAMVIPNVLDAMREAAVARNADEVRRMIGEARRLALDAGVDYQFRYETSGRSFVIMPTEQQLTMTNTPDRSDEARSEYQTISGEIDEGLTLAALDPSEERTESLDQQWFASMENGGELAQKRWSAPIVLRFDGTTEDFQFLVRDESRRTAELHVRGLTASVTRYPIYTEDQ